MDAGRHPLIDVVTNAEVIGCEGEPGNFNVTVRKNPRYVKEDLCVACGLCVETCPQIGGNEFDMGLKARKAIHRPFPQSVPSAYVIDPQSCLNFFPHLDEKQLWRLEKIKAAKQRRQPETTLPHLPCGHCLKACDVGAIDFDMKAEEFEVEAGAILVAVGFKEFDARKLGQYGYGRYPNVVTSLELERMLNASGVTGGHVVRPTDMETPKRIVFIQCVGARGEGGRPYCSRFCCMNAVKDSMLIRQHDPEVEDITILYTDLRAFGKGFDDFVRRSVEEQSAVYTRGRPAKIEPRPEDNTLLVYVEDTLEHEQKQIPADMVVLSVAAAPNDGAIQLAKILQIDTNEYGFIAPRDPAVSSVETVRDGIYVCGSAIGPQVIPDCVAQASASAARAELFLAGSRKGERAEQPELLDLSGTPRIGVMVCSCGANIGGVLDIEKLAAYSETLPNVIASCSSLFSCAETGQEQLVDLIKDNNLNRIVVASCTPRTHEPVFRETCASIGFNPYLLDMVNIRDQCSWVHADQPELAQNKARDLIRMSVARTRNLEPLHEGEVPMTRHAIVIGGGIAGIQTATDLAEQGFPVTLIEKGDELGGRLRAPNLKYLYPNLRSAEDVLKEKVDRLEKSSARILLNTQVEEISGFVGNFDVTIMGEKKEEVKAGVIVLSFGADLHDPAGEFGFDRMSNVITSEELERIFFEHDDEVLVDGNKPTSASFILCVGSREPDGFTGCSRYCCPTAIKQALHLNSLGIDTTILYRDIRTISAGAEEMYREARGKGVLFVRIPSGRKPEVVGKNEAEDVRCFDELLGQELEIESDLVILSIGMRPKQPETEKFHLLLKASLGLDGFFLERHPELAPVETVIEGVFLAGTVQGPKDIVDSVAQASAAAAKAAVLLSFDSVKVEPTVSVVDEIRCRACGTCVDVCPFQAAAVVETSPSLFVAQINPSLCKGCGTCAAWCPSSAIIAKHFTDSQVIAMIDTAFVEEVR